MVFHSINGCLCKKCHKWHDMIVNGVCINCRRKKEENIMNE